MRRYHGWTIYCAGNHSLPKSTDTMDGFTAVLETHARDRLTTSQNAVFYSIVTATFCDAAPGLRKTNASGIDSRAMTSNSLNMLL